MYVVYGILLFVLIYNERRRWTKYRKILFAIGTDPEPYVVHLSGEENSR